MHFVLHTELAATVVAQTNNQRDPLTCSTNAGILLGMLANGIATSWILLIPTITREYDHNNIIYIYNINRYRMI